MISRNGYLSDISQFYLKNFISMKNSPQMINPKILNSTRKNQKTSNSVSKCFNYSNIHILEPPALNTEKTIDPLSTLYHNSFFPRKYRNKNYIKEMKNCLPPLSSTINNFYSPQKVLESEYETTIDNFINTYKLNGDDLDDDTMNHMMKNNENYLKESNYINRILKYNSKNKCKTNRHHEDFTSPTNSFLTLKLNKNLINEVSNAVSNYQYQLYANKINNRQKDKLRLCIMPKANVKIMKFRIELNKQKQNNYKKNSILEEGTKKILTIDKDLIHKIKKKIDNNDKENQEDSKMENEETLSSTIIRNALILEVKYFYCKQLSQGTNNPNSRIEATFTPYFNNLFLFGGLQTSEQADLWMLDVRNNVYTWKKKIYIKERNLNPRYGHTTVVFNDNLYIYGGKFNLKKVRYPIEEILIYNINSNVLKSAIFKNERNSFSHKYIYIPPRRNHIAHVIGWNMIVHGGIDISKEYSKENNNLDVLYSDDIFIKNKNEIKQQELIYNYILGDFMALDLITMKWMKLSNIVYKKKNSKKVKNLSDELHRAYHSSCLILSNEHSVKDSKLNIYKNDLKKENNYVQIINDNDTKFEIKFEGIYIFGGIDENLQETNSLHILHCFRNPLVLFEPKLNGKPPSPRQMASMDFNKTLHYVTIFGGKDANQIFGDLFILDIINFQWTTVGLFGASISKGISGHCTGVVNDKLYIFGGCNENNQYLSAKVSCIELDLLRNKKIRKIYEFAKASLEENPKDRTAKNVMGFLTEGADLPPDVYPFLQLDRYK